VSIAKLSLALLFLGLLIVTIIGFLIKPVDFNLSLFYSLLAWSYFLVAINWYASIYSYGHSNTNNKNDTKFGVLPAIGLQAIIFSIISIATTYFFLSSNNFDDLPQKHWLVQFILLGLFLTFTVFSLIAAKNAELPEEPKDLRSKEELIILIDQVIINLQNEKSNQKNIETIKILKDSIKYSIPNLSILKDTEKYRAINKYVQIILEKSKDNRHIDENELNMMVGIARICK